MDNALIADENLKKPSKPAYYGTAGYRSKTSDLNNILCRASLIAYLRSTTFAGKIIGVMITASHNPVEYNGIKIIDHNGDMLDEVWEEYSDRIVNCDDEKLAREMKKILRSCSNQSELGEGVRGHVVLGRDTRDSGERLCNNIRSVLGKLNCTVDDYGVVTTPELHFLVRKCNTENRVVDKAEYMKNIAHNFNSLSSITKGNLRMMIDTANGVADMKLKELDGMLDGKLNYEVLNDPKGILNLDCGADFVKTKKRAPRLEALSSSGFSQAANRICASFDGDVDRLIFFTGPKDTEIFDGDSQAVFLALYIRSLLDRIESRLSIGVVLSYYSNNAAVDVLPPESFKVVMAQTGVKNFVSAAREFDVGIYFEPNGHGSVCFSQACIDEIEKGSTKSHAILKILANLFDPCIGDALANFVIFKALMGSADDLRKFRENPSRLLTVKIVDKNSIKVDQKNQVIEPKELQDKIDVEALSLGGRSFVRPSGTEDVVRVYAECPSEADADLLCLKVAQHVYDMCNGIGDHPEIDYTSK
ncbi:PHOSPHOACETYL-GLUCOSAMINE MUTASE [Encephalitozoon cuniculi GB-M1]|uniref:Probable phosphoacetylglucosamine mutase n=2 Tax=Encephalitozoon cuniculi TaxID=6035 RepID=AGM1_ENCCU|nr:phosphoacetylglucosamine mutase PCM1 [Encephalitozoon cuniculi GB-M1]Q8SSL7.1 RecName: Full=Probable phosphoacetylglucosamine mutase; Short=PAGM; AltName: Full=Acetylglucosamine phosphomutase; AltName: Full=N-acetylglucosamine-phosphate mutase [Encephalitozoon cuniculi GB-M1]AGE96022.1 phosphoacetyl-glucosamine mutase [Encephalitozoon cuniculi]KMV66719.1 phosphoacetylglucosamine mutase [Encephalitozoon cuniculi EcunIII-L]UYI28435.1 phosphoglucomutase/phosphomannomutase [Encephalitozoon cunic